MPPTSSSRLTTTASLILERSRVISLGLTPSPSTDTKIVRALRQVRDELVKREQELDGQGEGDEEEWKRWEALVGMMREDDVGRRQVAGLERPQRVSGYKDDEPEDGGYRDHEELSEPYRDASEQAASPEPLIPKDPPRGAAAESFDADLEAGDAQDMMLEHRNIIDDQDARLALLSTSINRQNDLSLQIGTELDLHQELLEETDQAMGHTQRNLERAGGRLRRVAEGGRGHCE